MSLALFVRHGRASAFGADYDELSAVGIEQSERFGGWLADWHVRINFAFVGPRKRHSQTFEAVARTLSARGVPLPTASVLPELDEHDGVSLLGKLLPTLSEQDPHLRAMIDSTARGVKPPPAELLEAFKRITRRWVRGEIHHDDVETFRAFRVRIGRALERIARVGRGKKALVITSAGAVASAVAEVLGVVDDEKVLDMSWAAYNASLTELAFAAGRWGVRSFNTTPHLHEPRLLTRV